VARAVLPSNKLLSMLRQFTRAALLLALTAACGKKDGSGLAPAASSLSPSKSDSVAGAWHFTVDPKSTTHVELPGLKEHIKGDTAAAAGTLDVVPTNLGESRGVVRIDLSTFETKTFGDDHDAAQTKHARTWLEAVVGDKVNEEMRWAEFAIRSIDNLGASDLTKIAAAKVGAEDVRTVSMTVHGELLVHGHKVPKDAAVDVSFGYSPGTAPDSKPERIEIKTKSPLSVVLKEHDVRPRDPAGQILSWTTNLIAKVADAADVSVDIRATPAP
jgi:hypothetical protein